MSRRTCDAPSEAYAVDLRAAIGRFLPHSGLALVGTDSKLCWTPRLLVVCAVLMSWDVSALITDAYDGARRVVGDLCRAGHRKQPGRTYHGFMRTLAARTPALLATVAATLRQHVEALARRADCWAVGASGGGWAAFGVDGSRDACPRTKSNKAAFGTSGRDKSGPQQFVTAVFHVGTGLAWDFRTGAGKASERSHLLEMLDTLPAGPRTLLLADAGFVGYEFFDAIMAAGRQFLIRVGANVKLITGLGFACREHDGVVYLWPAGARRRGLAPLVLRHVTVVDGRNRRMHLLTGVMSAADMTDGQAAELYQRRWGAELIFRALKQTLAKRKVRCACAANAATELTWAVVALWLLGLMAADAVVGAGGAATDWGVAASLRAVRRAMAGPPRRRGRASLAAALAAARKDAYARTGGKAATDWPHKKRDKPPGDPRARTATDAEIALAAAIKAKGVAA
jgi:hypothetical protein